MPVLKPYAQPAEALQAKGEPDAAPPGASPAGAPPNGQPGEGQPDDAASNPVIQGLKAIMQFGLALKEKGDPRGAELLAVVQKIPQILTGGPGGGEQPGGVGRPGGEIAPGVPKARPMPGREFNERSGSKPVVV